MSINQEEFKEMLKAKGLKVTNQRLIVLKVLDKHRDIHMAAEDISRSYVSRIEKSAIEKLREFF